MRISTGKGSISVITWASIISISLLINLPGLAVSPMLGNLKTIFPNSSELEEQLLTLAPNLLIIPFVLLSGGLSMLKCKKLLIVLSLLIFTASSVLYLFATNMTELIIYSCTLGIGCGLLIPFATGLIADNFTGRARVRQLGLSSALSNFVLVGATFLVGLLATRNWHLPFLVYLICLLPLALVGFLPKGNAAAKSETEAEERAVEVAGAKVVKGFYMRRTMGVTALYFFMCFLNGAVIYYLPYLMADYKMPDSAVGTVTSLFYVAIFLPGIFLPWVLRTFKNNSYLLCAIVMIAGIGLIILFHDMFAIGTGVILMGLSYGVYQPVSFDKATKVVNTPKKTTMALAIVMTANYVAVAAAAPIIDFVRSIFRTDSNLFPFEADFALMALFFIFYIFNRNRFSLSTYEYLKS